MKLCKDCKYVKDYGETGTYAKCVSPSNPNTVNKVTGEHEYTLMYCSSHRDSAWIWLDSLFATYEKCGSQGRWFEPKGEVDE